MARAAPKAALPGEAKRARRPLAAEESRLLGAALGASLLLAALLTIEVLPSGARTVGRLPDVGDIADHDYKALGEIAVVDEAATQAERERLLEQVPAIYDFDERAQGAGRELIRRAFETARRAGTDSGETALPADRVFAQALGSAGELPETAIRSVAQRGFAPEDEAYLLALLQPLQGQMITAEPAEFARQGEKRRVLVRELGSGREHVLADKMEVLSQELARERVREVSQRESPQLPASREPLLALAESLVRPNLSFNLRATDQRRQQAAESVKNVTIRLRKGEMIVREGDPVTERHRQILEGIRREGRGRSLIYPFLGVAALIAVALGATWRFASSGMPRFAREPQDAMFLLSALVVLALGTKLGLFLVDAVTGNPEFQEYVGSAPEELAYAIPVAAGAMLVRLVHNAETAVVFAVLASLIASLQVGAGAGYGFYALIGSMVAAVGAARVSQRGTLLLAGVRVGAANLLVILALSLFDLPEGPAPLALALLSGFFGGCLAGGLVTALAPVVEYAFAYTTDVKLLELANREQALLRELELRAPGTYHHSMMVGHLAEKAAEAIGANPLLAKVAGYYHDIGKMRRPHFFVENTMQRGENRHEKLAPSMSARIIQAHVRDGLELGRQHTLVPAIMNGIAQHHGTSVIRFFFEKAKEQLDPERGDVVEEQQYRYPGPKPQTREAGILMLADSVEAASRTLADPSRPRVQLLVQRIINNYFRDGQLDECSLTLRDLHAIARSLIDTLVAIRHERIDYPEATEARKPEEPSDEGVVERLEPRKTDRSGSAADSREDDLRRLGLP
jgi:hypothetical protein